MNDVWTTSPAGRDGRITLTLVAGPPRPLTASLTEAELAAAAGILRTTADAVGRGEFSRVQLGRGFREAIGRDPFRQVRPRTEDRWWLNVVHVFIGLAFASSVDAVWLKLAGYAFALVALGLLLHTWHRRRRG
ncbi:hypothetical protein Aab01nite_01850 [Paractinoplanes abujensis]|uniref:Uncharacterized protein n=1 Tax=Paractinoplanes abujensis TaxID=882441 RepID=A0A7W7G0T7_9ACTN|nr:hypothetical protein [Actinoplanes abujensis]MBB4691987.1 hypothetical protein [Actinoplanes abujensis]GID16595.1 hypothetical protein Aab01nite_01850 [Actinoplanes abujensis]